MSNTIDKCFRNIWTYHNKICYMLREMSYRKKVRNETEYWKTVKHTGNGDSGEYYVIRRKGKAGLFSLYITTIGQIKYAIDHGLIPIVDFKNYSNTLQGIDQVGTYGKGHNPWEDLFIQPSEEKLTDVEMTAKTLWYCEEDIPGDRPSDNTDFLYSLNQNNEWRGLALEYLKVQPHIIEEAEALYRKITENGNNRVLGVLCRGTDYFSLHPKDHPIQPNVDEMLDQTDFSMKEYSCKKVFLATEDAAIERAFREKYKDALFVINEKKIDYKGYGHLYDTSRLMSQGDRIQNATIYLKKILILSMCNCFIAGRTSGTVAVMLQNHHFDYTYFFDLGRY